jgi:hypothetical protein
MNLIKIAPQKSMIALLLLVCLSCDDSSPDKRNETSSIMNDLQTDTWVITHFFDTQDETDHFAGYVFTFNDDGTVVAAKDASAINGMWSVSSSGNGGSKLNLDFDVIDPFDELNDDWDVTEHTSDLLRLKDVSGGSGETDLLTFEKVQ